MTSSSSIEKRSKREELGASMLADERDIIGEELQREEPHESLSPSPSPSSSTAEKRCTRVLRCFTCRCQFRVSC